MFSFCLTVISFDQKDSRDLVHSIRGRGLAKPKM